MTKPHLAEIGSTRLRVLQETLRTGAHSWRIRAEQYDDMNFTPSYLSKITARTLNIFGDRDPFYPVSIALYMHNAIPKHSFRSGK